MKALLLSGICALLSVPSAWCVEIATGSMLGPRYKSDRFYMRSGRLDWKQTYEGGPYRGQAEGKIFFVRLTQAIFDDEWLTEKPFDPEKNTDAVIAALDEYKRFGALGIIVGMQGGDPGYSVKTNGIARSREATHGEGKGALVSAYRADGSLKPDWTARLERLLRAADQRGMVVCLVYFDQGQDEVLEGPRGVTAAARNLTRWLIAKDFRNVIIDLADSWDEGGLWDHLEFIPRNVGGLVVDVRDQFNGADFLLPIGASSGPSMTYPASLAKLCDVVLLHGDGRAIGDKSRRLSQVAEYKRPVVVISDDNGGVEDPESASRERAAADSAFRNAAGWTYTPRAMALRFPFRYLPGPAPSVAEDAALDARRAAYFRAVLDHVAAWVLKKPPGHDSD